jgi:molecular chaperone GrpE
MCGVKEKNNNKNNEKPLLDEMVTIPKKEYDALRSKHDERDSYYDKYVRAHAEFENAKRRMEKDKVDFLKYANESFVVDLLPIIDSLDMSERHIKEAKDFKAVQEGVDMIHVQIQKFLKDIGVERVKTVGEKFDPNLQEAVETIDDKDKEEGTITEELKPGYKFNGRLLRPASVRIVKHKD